MVHDETSFLYSACAWAWAYAHGPWERLGLSYHGTLYQTSRAARTAGQSPPEKIS